MKLGDLVKDKISGYEGVAIAHITYMHNSDRWGLRSRELHEGKPVESVFFDEVQLEVTQEDFMEVVPCEEPLFNFGDEIKDTLTDFKGTVTAIAFWTTGCIRIGVQAKPLHDGAPVDEIFAPQGQLKLVKAAKIIKVKKVKEVKKPGGPMKNPGYIKDPK